MQTRNNKKNKKNKTKKNKLIVKPQKNSKSQRGGSFFGSVLISSTALLVGYKYLKNREENKEYWKTQEPEFKKTLESIRQKEQMNRLIEKELAKDDTNKDRDEGEEEDEAEEDEDDTPVAPTRTPPRLPPPTRTPPRLPPPTRTPPLAPAPAALAQAFGGLTYNFWLENKTLDNSDIFTNLMRIIDNMRSLATDFDSNTIFKIFRKIMNPYGNRQTDLLEIIKDKMNDLSIYNVDDQGTKEISQQTIHFLTSNTDFTNSVIDSIQNDFNYWTLASGVYNDVPNYQTDGLYIIESITNFIIKQFTTLVNGNANIYLCDQTNLPQNEIIICQSAGQGGKGSHFELKYNDKIIKIKDDGSCLFRALLLFDYIQKNDIQPNDDGFLNPTLLVDVSV